MPCGSEALSELMKDVLVPALNKVVFDRAPSVRKQLALALATWFTQIDAIQQFYAALLPLLLAGVVDESPEVQSISLQQLDALAVVWAERLNRDSDAPEPMAVDSGSNSGTPPVYFAHAPAPSVRALAVRCVLPLPLFDPKRS